MSARAGVVPAGRGAAYVTIALAAALVVAVVVVSVFGWRRAITGVLVGLVVFAAISMWLFNRDAVLLSDDAIRLRLPWRRAEMPWSRVVAARFARDDRMRWALAFDLTNGDEPHHELPLLAMPPVIRQVGNAYESRKREQVVDVLDVLRRKRIPMTILPEIREALHAYWKIDIPVG